MGLTLVQSPRQSFNSRKTLYRDARWLTTSEPVSAKVVPDDVSFSLEPALPDGRCFRPFLRWFHHPFFILRPMRCDRMGALSMYQSPRYPHGSISPRNLALALKRRFLEHRHRHPPPTGPITPRPRLEISLKTKNAKNAGILPAFDFRLEWHRHSCLCAFPLGENRPTASLPASRPTRPARLSSLVAPARPEERRASCRLF